jgi:bacterioferritin
VDNTKASTRLTDLLNEAIARELTVCIQYMFQHSVGTLPGSAVSGKSLAARQSKFVGSHSSIWLPGSTLRKIAIAEMRHAEAIAERVVCLGQEPTTQPNAIVLGKTVDEMLRNDREQEQQAIQLYRQIVRVAAEERDDVTRDLFGNILADEEKHFRTFSDMLGTE